MRVLRFISGVLLCWLISGGFLLSAQTAPAQVAASAPVSADETRYPDAGYLSSNRYTNAYFDFSFEVPTEAHLRPVIQPASSDGNVQVLELGGPPPADARISIVAYPAASRQGDAKTLLRKALDQELYVGVEELRSLSKTSCGGHTFYLFETRRGIEQHMLLAAELNGYVVQVFLAAHDDKLLKQIEWRFEHLQFFPPSQLRQYIDADAKAYEGPEMSSRRLASLHANPPANHIAPGEVEGTVYRNAALGFNYRFPEGWSVQPHGAVEPALARSQSRDELLLDGTPRPGGGTEQQLMRVCSRTLFSAWAKPPRPDGLLTYDDFGEVTISAIASGCFPGLAFPSDATDREAFKTFIADLGLTHPVLRDMRDAKVISSNGNVFLLLRGVLAMQLKDEDLSRRISVAMAVTRRRGYLLLMFFAAPHDSELQPLLEKRVSFDAEPRPEEETASKGGGETAPSGVKATSPSSPGPIAGTSSQQNNSSVPSPASSPEPATADVASAGSASSSGASGTGSTATAAADPNSAAEQGSASNARPTLLRPGESMQDQQVKGAPISRH